MINYSIVRRPVNSNLFEINAAKGRIKAAREASREPAAEDLAIVATEVQYAFGVAQYTDVMDIDKFARHIASHGCVYSRADISAILNMAVDCMREQLLDGKKIRLGDLGDFAVAISSMGVKDPAQFGAGNIKDVKVVWTAGQQFMNLMGDAEFNLVASRAAQAKVIKAVKSGETTVDLQPDPTTPPEDNGTDGPDGNGGQTGTTLYTVSVSPADAARGSVTGGGSFAQGTSVTITAVPASGYKFSQWNDGDSTNPRTLIVDKDYALVATFETADEQGGGEDGPTFG